VHFTHEWFAITGLSLEIHGDYTLRANPVKHLGNERAGNGMRIAVLGLGAMGSRMALQLLDAGHQVSVFNRTSSRAQAVVQAGAILAVTPKEAAERSDIVISMVTDDLASRQVWLEENTGAIHGLRSDSIALESSTLTLEWVNELAAAVSSTGAGFLDAPVAGSRPQAEAGQLIYLIGGAANHLERVKPILEVMGGRIEHIGPVGQGMAMKLAVNALFGIQVAAVAELLGFMRNAGLDEARAVAVLSEMPVMSPAAKVAATQMLAKNFAPLFPIDLVEKDIGYLIESARAVNADVPSARATQAVFARAQLAGYGADHISGVAQLFDHS
jgi:3-hydroxyisobutyrate dehydrogenase